ncbi:MAG: InlB B-repeat-containing protein [Lachnospiraceae bacterium]|nr:InlB B-repeat-containing protein [Lachnospiraceae bacterium]
MKNKRTLLFRHLRRMVGKTCIAAALMLVLALTGALSALPGIGKAFKPLTAYAASVTINGGTWTYNGANIIKGTEVYALNSGDDLIVGSTDTQIDLDADLTLGSLTISSNTNIDVKGHTLIVSGKISGNYDLVMEGSQGYVQVGSSSLMENAIDVGQLSVDNLKSFQSTTGSGSAISASGNIVIENIGDGGISLTGKVDGGGAVESAGGVKIYNGNGKITNSAAGGYGIYANGGSVTLESIQSIQISGGWQGITTASNQNVVISSCSDVMIEGTNTSYGYGMYVHGTFKIENSTVVTNGIVAYGNGTSTIENSTFTTTQSVNSAPSAAIDCSSTPGSSLTISQSNVKATSSSSNSGILSTGDITISGADTVVEATGTTTAIETNANIIINSPLGVFDPAGGSVASTHKEIADASGNTPVAHTIIKDLTKTYTITFEANGGTVTPATGTTGTDGKLASLPTPTHTNTNMQFLGWFTAATGGTAVDTSTVFTGNDTIYAQWQDNTPAPTTYTITLNANGGTVNGKTTDTATTGTDGKLASLPTPTHTNTNMQFLGWFTAATGGTQVTTATVFTADTIIYARWEDSTHPAPTPTPTPTPSGGTSTGTGTGTYNIWYEFTEGHSQTWMKGSATPALFTAVRSAEDNTTFSRFTGVTIDGVVLDKAHYTATEGSVKLSISADYLNTLSEGTHTIRALFTDGHAEGQFIVLSAAAPANMTRVTPPQTSDENVQALMFFGALLMFSLAGACLIARRGRFFP